MWFFDQIAVIHRSRWKFALKVAHLCEPFSHLTTLKFRFWHSKIIWNHALLCYFFPNKSSAIRSVFEQHFGIFRIASHWKWRNKKKKKKMEKTPAFTSERAVSADLVCFERVSIKYMVVKVAARARNWNCCVYMWIDALAICGGILAHSLWSHLLRDRVCFDFFFCCFFFFFILLLLGLLFCAVRNVFRSVYVLLFYVVALLLFA